MAIKSNIPVSRSEEVKDLILDGATNIFAKFGFRKTTVDEIAQAARKGKSSIYYYFNSKEEIFQAVVEKEVGEVKSKLISVAESTDPANAKLKNYIVLRMQMLKELANVYEALKDDFLSHYEFIEEIRKDYDELELSFIENILKEGAESGEFDIQDFKLTAISILTIFKGLEIPIFIKIDESHFEERVDNLIHLILNGLAKR